MSALSSVEMVSFDVWMTLIHNHPDSKPAQAKMVSEAFGVKDPDFISIMRQEDLQADIETDATGVQFGPVERLDRIARRLGVPVVRSELELLAQQAQDLAGNYHPIPMEDGLLDTLDAIRSTGVRTAIISNTGFLDGDRMRKNLGAIGIMDRMDYSVFSNEEGLAKPDPRIFQALASKSGVDPSRIVHIGDNAKADYDGALNAGFQAVHLSASSKLDPSVPSIAAFAGMLNQARNTLA